MTMEKMPKTKVCTKCEKRKPLESFYLSIQGKWGRHSQCISCKKNATKNWAAKNPDKVKERSKAYYEQNSDKIKKRTRQWSQANPERKKESDRAWRVNNRERNRLNKRKWYHQNIEKARAIAREKTKRYAERNPDKIRARYKTWANNAYATNLQRKLTVNVRNNLRRALKLSVDGVKHKRSVEYLGCSIETLKEHLEKQFQPGMTWDNWSKDGWHIDHIKPLASFDLTDERQLRKACHYTNLQPMWAEENLKKGARVA